jgi:Cu+-exporting ATPase
MSAADILVVVMAVAALAGLGWFFFGPRKATAAVLAGALAAAEPQILTPTSAEPAPVTDPVCGMTVDPVTAAGHRGTGPDTVYFCSAGYAAAYDAQPGRPVREKVAQGGMS